MGNRILLFNGDSYIETVPRDGLQLDGGKTIALDGNAVFIDGQPLELYSGIRIEGGYALLLPEVYNKYSMRGKSAVSISTDEGAHIRLPAGEALNSKKPSSRKKAQDTAPLHCAVTPGTLNILSGSVYINGTKAGSGLYELRGGDRLYANGVEMYLGGDHVGIRGEGYTTSLNEYIPRTEHLEDFPDYKRSPRIIKHEPTQAVELQAPPSEAEKKKGELLKLILPTVGMAAVTSVMSFIMGRGIMVLMAIGGTLVSLVVSVTNFIQNKKDAAKKEKERGDAYVYMVSIFDEIHGGQDNVGNVKANDQKDLTATEDLKKTRFMEGLEIKDVPNVATPFGQYDVAPLIGICATYAGDIDKHYDKEYGKMLTAYNTSKTGMGTVLTDLDTSLTDWSTDILVYITNLDQALQTDKQAINDSWTKLNTYFTQLGHYLSYLNQYHKEWEEYYILGILLDPPVFDETSVPKKLNSSDLSTGGQFSAAIGTGPAVPDVAQSMTDLTAAINGYNPENFFTTQMRTTDVDAMVNLPPIIVPQTKLEAIC